MADTYRPDIDVIESGRRTVGEGLRAFAADFIEAVTELMELITVLFNIATLVKMGSAFTMVMYSPTIGKEWTVQVVESR